MQPAATDAEGRIYIFNVENPTPTTKVRKLFQRLLSQTEDVNGRALTPAEKTALKKNEAVIARLNIRRKHVIRGTHAIQDKIFNPDCKVGLHVRGYITSKRKITSAFMDVEGNFFEVRSRKFTERAAWSYPNPLPSTFLVVWPVHTGKPVRIKREVRIKVQKFAEMIFPLFIETLDAE
jgi:hypothetical protein